MSDERSRIIKALDEWLTERDVKELQTRIDAAESERDQWKEKLPMTSKQIEVYWCMTSDDIQIIDTGEGETPCDRCVPIRDYVHELRQETH